MNVVRLQALHRDPPSSRLCWLWSQKKDLQQAWNWERRAVWDQVGLSQCRHDGLVTVQDTARLRQGYNDQSQWGHQCSETMLTGESRCYRSTRLGIEPGSLMTGSKWLTHWTSKTVCECSEIAGSPHCQLFTVFKNHITAMNFDNWISNFFMYWSFACLPVSVLNLR